MSIAHMEDAIMTHLPTLFKEIDELFDMPFWGTRSPAFKLLKDCSVSDRLSKPSNMPQPDVVGFDDRVEIRVPVAGYRKEDISVSVENDILQINAKKRKLDDEKDNPNYYMRGISLSGFEWNLRLSDTSVDTEKIKATIEDGLLQVILPRQKKKRQKVIDIK